MFVSKLNRSVNERCTHRTKSHILMSKFSPLGQNVIIAIILGLVVGPLQSITILGAGGGQPNAALMANITNATLYAFVKPHCKVSKPTNQINSIYCLLGFVTGSVVTTLGPKWTMVIAIGSCPTYLGSFWYCMYPSSMQQDLADLMQQSYENRQSVVSRFCRIFGWHGRCPPLDSCRLHCVLIPRGKGQGAIFSYAVGNT